MNRRPVTSSHVAALGWEDDTLEVEFISGHVYQYHDVSEQEYRTLLGADSIGKHLHELKAAHQCTKIK